MRENRETVVILNNGFIKSQGKSLMFRIIAHMRSKKRRLPQSYTEKNRYFNILFYCASGL